MNSIDHVPTLDISIPELPPGKYHHHPVSKGQNPDFYKPLDPRDTALAKTAWVDFFEKVLAAMYWKIGAPVPYAFRTYDGTIRSLDAGCLKFLANRNPPEVTFIVDAGGFIDKVEPSPKLRARYLTLKDTLVGKLDPKT